MSTVPSAFNLVLILTGGYGFPAGDAYTNRILAFAKGFARNGCKVTILILYPGRHNTVGTSGSIEGFDYQFCTGLTWPESLIKKKVTGFTGIVNSIRFLTKLNAEKPIDGIITFSQKYTQNFPIYLFTRNKKIIFIRENNEYPRLVLKKGNTKITIAERLYFSLVNRIYDGYIYISSALVEFNRPMLKKGMPVLTVPIIVDTERFSFPDVERDDRIVYCGNVFGEKDGVRILLEALAMVTQKLPAYKLTLIGDVSNTAEYESLLAYINEKGISSRVEFTGFVNRNEIPGLLKRSSLLVLSRPDNIQAKGGFPTKLGEYLASGRPVLVTAVGDIPEYIRHGVNGFLAQPGSAEDFASKMYEILSDYDNATKVGLEGKKLTETDFNSIYQAGRVVRFMEKIKKTKD